MEALSRRFIPAWAGNTARARSARRSEPVHPRVGGEHSAEMDGSRFRAGSSPRGRGTHRRVLHPIILNRFIPAWAGNTAPPGTATGRTSVHPRVGGEHRRGRMGVAGGGGSSPRGRGTQRDQQAPVGIDRFIPAWAGNTRTLAGRPSRRSVHPRVGGEHAGVDPTDVTWAGSSPRGRGTPHPILGRDRDDRFIPAWAGNTRGASDRSVSSAVHPRVGGEHS